jgi:hypothetical protein
MNLDAGERFPPEVLRNGFERDEEALDVRREQIGSIAGHVALCWKGDAALPRREPNAGSEGRR